ncbi:MAG TPA: V-type ATP synthase subunit A [Spirochaetota bacterium]|nr:V-type ATP synthase subunit A [Spirochaetota bacterium]
MNEQGLTGKIISVNGPIVRATGLKGAGMLDMAEVGPFKLIGEVIRFQNEVAVIQVYEDNTGLKPGDTVSTSGRPLSVLLGPGLISNIYDGIQRPLISLEKLTGSFITKGVKASPLDTEKKWDLQVRASAGDDVHGGTIIGEIRESSAVIHKVIVPPAITGKIEFITGNGEYNIEQEIYRVKTESGVFSGRLANYWPVRIARPFSKKKKSSVPLVTGQRIIDTFFPIARGGTAAIPGGFGTGKTMTQHALAKWCDAEIIVYIGCGERGNEMTDVLNEFPKLVDPRSGRPLMERTVMIANTSNMPVAAREVSIYTGVTIAEYYRDMGYSVAIMADSTSRWAEALRELSSRLGDMPAEEGFPSYLATRLAEFYERSGYVDTLGGGDGSISIIGAVSPPGGDFSEPVTQHTTRFVRCFWALDKVLADARHYPSISWIDSYSEYIDDIKDWWLNVDSGWQKVRKDALNILLEENRLQQIVKLVGPDALPVGERFLLFCAELIKNGFLQQNAFDPKDMYSTPQKQMKLLKIITGFYAAGNKHLEAGAALQDLLNLKSISEITRLKSDTGNDELDKIDEFEKRLEADFSGLTERLKQGGAGDRT